MRRDQGRIAPLRPGSWCWAVFSLRPLAAYAFHWLPERWLMMLLGVEIVLLSLREAPRILTIILPS